MKERLLRSVRPSPRVLGGAAILTMLTILLVLSAGVLMISAQDVPADEECMVARFNKTKPASVTALNCTSNDVELAVYELVSGPTSCIEGERIDIVVAGDFVATSAERWDVGVFIATDGGNPNSLGGTCYQDFLHPVSTDNTDLDLTGGSGPYFNGEIDEDPEDMCGDIQQGLTNTHVFETISVICQDSDNNNVADVTSCTVWANSRSDGEGKPSCIDEGDVTAETTAKCTCGDVEITGLTVPETAKIEVIKNLEPNTDPGRFNLQIDSTDVVTDVGHLGTTGVISVSAGTEADPGDLHSVGETGYGTTDLGDYNSSIECVLRGTNTVVANCTDCTSTAPWTVLPDQDIVCTITNTLVILTPEIATDPDPDKGIVGDNLQDSATLTGGNNPTGEITFYLYGPDDETCSGTEVYSETVDVSAGGAGTVTGYDSDAIGTYHWVASYSGDDYNYGVDSVCANEPVVIDKAQPTISTVAVTPVTVGEAISDTATIGGLVNPTGLGTITFKLYSDDTCATQVWLNVVSNINADGDYSSDDHIMDDPGTYYWRAFFSGDANNKVVDTPCKDANETSVVDKAQPEISTSAVTPVTVGEAISDTATIDGLVNPTGDGTITFKLYSDDTCATQVW
ncbi:hypothetical protein ACFLYD_07345, partial [Chloroflexota bacterium]